MIYAEMVDRVSGSWRRLESIRIAWGYKYLAPTLQGALIHRVTALNGISGLHHSRQIGRVALRVHTKPGECGLSHTLWGCGFHAQIWHLDPRHESQGRSAGSSATPAITQTYPSDTLEGP